MRRVKISQKLVNDIVTAIESPCPIQSVMELIDKAYDLGYTRGREAGINDIFTYHPED